MYEKTFLGAKSLFDYSASSLFVVLKDHNCQEAVRIITTAQTRSICKAVEDQDYCMNHVEISEGENYSAKPAQLVLTKRIHADVAMEIRAGLI